MTNDLPSLFFNLSQWDICTRTSYFRSTYY